MPQRVVEQTIRAELAAAEIAVNDVSGTEPCPAVAAFRDCRVLAESGAMFVGGDFAGH
jgi:hypothetical protein